MSDKVIKASNLVVGRDPITISTPWSTAFGEMAAGGEEDEAGLACAGEEQGGAEGEEDPERAAREALAREQAGAVIGEAQVEAERLLTEARDHAATVREEARQQGYQDGYAAGQEQGLAEGRTRAEAEMEAAVKQTMKVLTAAVHERSQIVAASRDDVLKIVRKVAEKVIRAEVRLDPSVVERAIDVSLRLVTERSQVLVRVNPQDVGRAREGVPHFLRYFTPSAVVEVCADPRVAPGGCLVETNAGNVDAQLETQLEEVLAHLEERLYGG